MKNSKNGFTLVELLAVIVILAIILVIAVPKVMSIIEDSKKATLESTAKMIASSAEKAKVQNEILGKTEKITCESVAKINNLDYQGCKIEFDNNGKALVTIIGNGKFKGYNVCKGSKNNSSAVEESCSLVTLIINPNGGNLNKKYEDKYEAGVTIELATPTKEGYVFKEWKAVSGENASVNGNVLTIGATATEIEAIWEQNVYEISYNLDGGMEGENSPKTGTVGSEITIPNPKKEGYIFRKWIISGAIINGNKITIETSNITLSAVWEPLGATYIINLLKNESTLNNGIKQTTAMINNESVDVGIRYVGANPNNYVYFNCKDNDDSNIVYGEDNYDYDNSCEIWRIIGVFAVDNGAGKVEKRVKIVRDAFSTKMTWDSSSSGVNSGWGINEWSQADIKNMLNGYYTGEETTCKYCNDTNQGTCKNDCISSITPLSNTSLSMVVDVLWNLGAQIWNQNTSLSVMYEGERSDQIGKICTSGDLCNDSVKRTTEWVGKVGLIYPSDYGYASTDEGCAGDIVSGNSTCNVNNWLHPQSEQTYWTILPNSTSDRAVNIFIVSPSDQISAGATDNSFYVRPSLYLSSNVEIRGGDGTSDNPYKLK